MKKLIITGGAGFIGSHVVRRLVATYAELGWTPSLQFNEGLEKTVDCYLENEAWRNDVTSGDYQHYYRQQYESR